MAIAIQTTIQIDVVADAEEDKMKRGCKKTQYIAWEFGAMLKISLEFLGRARVFIALFF